MSALKNGARRHAVVTGAGGRQWVLAEVCAAAEPWITWEVDRVGNTYHGHYFKSRNDAVADLLSRVIL